LAPGCSIFNQEKQGQNSSNPARIRQAATEDVKQKNPENNTFPGFVCMLELALGEIHIGQPCALYAPLCGVGVFFTLFSHNSQATFT
jgi:hypothetical protein